MIRDKTINKEYDAAHMHLADAARHHRIRNHLLDFLVDRPRAFAQEAQQGSYDPRQPPLVTPGEAPDEPTEVRPQCGASQRPLTAVV